VQNRGLQQTEAAAMIAAQMPADQKRKRSHHVIDNSSTLADLEATATELWSRIGMTP
jgi:dephospho-CoA kinase